MVDTWQIEDLDFIEEDEAESPPVPVSATDRALEQAYVAGRYRVLQDRSDFFLPHIVDFIEGRQWGNLRPEYQRRLRWDNAKKSRLIESLLMNVPVPSIFLFDSGEYKYEVLDGQQRVSTIVDFIQGRFELEDLKVWPEINGKVFSRLPPAMRQGLQRAKLSATILLSDPKSGSSDQGDLRTQVFDRLNTGGEKLNPQELRNCLFSGPFNRLIVQLSGLPKFTKAWNVPDRASHTLSDGSYDEALRTNKLFSTMGDCQIVLRFFAFTDRSKITGSTKDILDRCMAENRFASEAQIALLSQQFQDALNLCVSVLGTRAFRADFDARRKGKLSRPLFDAEMIAMHNLRDRKAEIIPKKQQIRDRIEAITKSTSAEYDTIVGRPNTSKAILARQVAVQKAIEAAL